MMKNIFEKLLISKASRFFEDFTHDSKEVFVDDKGKIYHNGEFGMYRERLVKNFLSCILPQRLSIGSGFIITKNGNISTQCDIIIYDNQNCPIIENEENQTFFPIECVVAIGEIKSNIQSKAELKKILNKIQKNKQLRNDIFPNPIASYRSPNVSSIIDPSHCPEDSITTFLICNEIEFPNKKDAMINIYSDSKYYSRHNVILSLKDGTYLYNFNREIYYAPIFDGNKCNDIFIPRGNDNYSHIIVFLNYLYLAISNNTIFRTHISDYLADKSINYCECENSKLKD